MLVGKNPPADSGDIRDTGSILGLGRSPGAGHGNPFQYSCLENPKDRGAWLAKDHRVVKNQARLKQLSMHAPSGPVAKNPPCNAEDVGSIAGQGTKIPCAVEQLSP